MFSSNTARLTFHFTESPSNLSSKWLFPQLSAHLQCLNKHALSESAGLIDLIYIHNISVSAADCLLKHTDSSCFFTSQRRNDCAGDSCKQLFHDATVEHLRSCASDETWAFSERKCYFKIRIYTLNLRAGFFILSLLALKTLLSSWNNSY